MRKKEREKIKKEEKLRLSLKSFFYYHFFLGVQDENFYINDGSLHFNSTRRLVSESLAIGLWKKGEDGEADELINCLLLRLDANDKHCNFVRNCTTVISVLASISLILAMAFSISLIVIHRRKALTCRFWGKKSVDDDNCSTNCQPE